MGHHKKLEIFCGTGGVGKTTLASSRALFLAHQQKRVLLITVDPSQRLKEVLSIEDHPPGKVARVSLSLNQQKVQLDALLMSPETTFQRVFQEKFQDNQQTNRILKILSRPFGGLNEILALLELEYYFNRPDYDVIILDTPPGRHFIDFLKSGDWIHQFFNKSFINIFRYFSGKVPKNKNIVQLVVKVGLKKLVSYLEYMTGKVFVKDFVEVINIVYSLKDSFLRASQLPTRVKEQNLAHWFLVTSVEHNKLLEAENLQEQMMAFTGTPPILLINRCVLKHLEDWAPHRSELQEFKNSLLHRERAILKRAQEFFQHFRQFDDINSQEPIVHLEKLAVTWENED